MSGGDLLGISTSGIVAAQRALTTTGHNIANATTPGYSRQRVDLETRPPQMFGNGAMGTGVIVNNIDRTYNEFLVSEVRDTTSANKYLDKTYEYTSQVDNMLADPQAGLAPAMSGFFDAVNGVANEPSSTASREVLLGSARNLADRFAYLNNRFEGLREAANKDMRAMMGDVNQIAKGIAEINRAIVRSQEISTRPPNDLLDQRDRLVQELSERVNVRVTVQDDGRMNVFVGNGQTLVVGDDASRLDIAANEHDPSRLEVLFVGQGSNIVITQFMNGGQLGGIAKFRNEVLDPAQNELGRIAIGIAKSFNDQHHLGMDMNNKLGEDFFSEIDKLAPQVSTSINNKGNLEFNAEITDANKLTTSNYSLLYRQGQYELLRLDDAKVVARFKDLPQTMESEGFKLSIKSGGSIQDGDHYLIQPTRRAADLFAVQLSSVDKVAAASPLRVASDIDNLGNAKITLTQVNDTKTPAFSTAQGELSPPYLVRFTDNKHFEILDNTGKPVKVKLAAVADDPDISLHKDNHTSKSNSGSASNKQEMASQERHAREGNNTTAQSLGVVEGPIEYDARKGVQLFPTAGGIERGFTVRLDGDPKAGDLFRIEFNSDASSDNKNALALADLQTKPMLMDGKSDYAQTYGQLVSRVGSKTHELDINRQAQKLLLQQAVDEKEANSGVNLDEEAADMVRYQNQYQANAQVIATANRVMEMLMEAFRR
ncbi:MAG: flagellar hook-associated protein FlgK [Gammaproteobacteria bacterium]|nr:flagellar hook-associated protein FlgK [Gammaproteobacteria bacterium]